MNDLRTKNSLSPTRQFTQRGRRSTVPFGGHTGVLALLSLAACGSGGGDDDTTPTPTPTPTLIISDQSIETEFGAKQHDQQTIDLGDIFLKDTSTTYTASNLPHGVVLTNGTLTFTNTELSADDYVITITEIENGVTLSHSFTYSLNVIKDQNGDDSTTYSGTTLDDAITGNTFAKASGTLTEVDLDGGAGSDNISNNTLTAGDIGSITFDGGVDNDTISNNTLTAGSTVYSITFDGGDGNDTISDNHFESPVTFTDYDVYSVTLMGGAGDDLFRDNTATIANGKSALMTIDGGDGEDTVVFRSIAGEYAGLSNWIDGVTTVTLTGDGAAVTLIDVENISFANGVSYRAAEAGVEDNGGILYDLANAFTGTFTAYTTNRGTIDTDNTLTLAGTELRHGANTIVITATIDSTETTETITVNAVKTLKIAGAKQHDQQTIDLDAIFVDANTYTYTHTAQTWISLNNSILSFDNTNSALSEGEHTIMITATDSSDMFTHTLTYALDTIQSQTFFDGGSNSSYIGTTYADAITSNSFSAFNLSDVDLDGRAGNDNISSNTLTATSQNVNFITFDGGTGDDTIRGNTFIASGNIFSVTFAGGDGNDTISDNTLSGYSLGLITFAGGDGSDTISDNTVEGVVVDEVTIDSGAGDDTISDNHFASTENDSGDYVYAVTLMGGAGNDEFSGNTATQNNNELSSITIDGGADTDKVYFELASSMFTVAGAYGSNITVTDKAARTEAKNGVDSYAEYVLIEIEELYFNEVKYEF